MTGSASVQGVYRAAQDKTAHTSDRDDVLMESQQVLRIVEPLRECPMIYKTRSGVEGPFQAAGTVPTKLNPEARVRINSTLASMPDLRHLSREVNETRRSPVVPTAIAVRQQRCRQKPASGTQ